MNGGVALLITLSVMLSAAAQIALKGGMMSAAVQRAMATGGGALAQVTHILFNPLVLLGLFFYGASAAIWLLVLARIPVSTAYPFVAVAIVLTSLLGRLIYNDPFSPAKIVATLLIVGGVAVMARA